MTRLIAPFKAAWRLWVRIVTSGGVVLLCAVVAAGAIGGSYALTWALWPRVAFLFTTHVLVLLIGVAWRDARRTKTKDVNDYQGGEIASNKQAVMAALVKDHADDFLHLRESTDGEALDVLVPFSAQPMVGKSCKRCHRPANTQDDHGYYWCAQCEPKPAVVLPKGGIA